MKRGGALDRQGLGWLVADGPEHEIVLSTRVRLARNLQGFPFSIRAGAEERARILSRVSEAIAASEALPGLRMWEMASLDPVDRRLLLERHLVSHELTGDGGGVAPPSAALALAEDGAAGVMINEEDHLRLQALANGLQLDRAWLRVLRMDDEVGKLVPYAFHPEFGFLTSCPTNVGTGLRASVLVHLPGLVLTKEISRVLHGISQVGLTYRGLYGEGSEVVGNFFQLSNQTTLGKSEGELIDHLGKIVGQVIRYEKDARAVLYREAPAVVEDKVWRAYGILRHARSLSFDEMMNLLSGVRLGLNLKLLPTPRVSTLNEIIIFAQTAHLARAAGRNLDESEADVSRAEYVRQALETDAGRPSGPPGGSDSNRQDAAE